MAMECVSISPAFAKYCMKKWLTIQEQIDAGPMAELWTAIEEWSEVIKRRDSKIEKQILAELGVDKRSRVLWPTIFSNNTLGMGNSLRAVLKGQVGLQNAPVTQCYYPGHNTLTHHEKLGSVYQKGTIRQMEILETLYERKD